MTSGILTTTLAHECTCELGEMCASHAAGHGLSFIQDRLARAASALWVDAVVEASGDGTDNARAEGWVTLRTLDDHQTLRVWNHGGFAVQAGEPVALHRAYHVLAAGRVRYNVAVTA